MDMQTVKKEYVADTNLGVYVALSNGKYIVDSDDPAEAQQLSIQAWRGDQRRIDELIREAKSFGLENITVEFIPDVRKVTQEEYEEQQQRLAEGKTPDPYDLGALIDDYKAKHYGDGVQ